MLRHIHTHTHTYITSQTHSLSITKCMDLVQCKRYKFLWEKISSTAGKEKEKKKTVG